MLCSWSLKIKGYTLQSEIIKTPWPVLKSQAPLQAFVHCYQSNEVKVGCLLSFFARKSQFALLQASKRTENYCVCLLFFSMCALHSGMEITVALSNWIPQQGKNPMESGAIRKKKNYLRNLFSEKKNYRWKLWHVIIEEDYSGLTSLKTCNCSTNCFLTI